MAGLMLWRIEPLAGFLPQASWHYTTADLARFASALHDSGQGAFYRNVLRLDLVFMALWAVWVMRAFGDRPRLGLAIAALPLGCDLAENIILEQQLAWALGRSVPTDWTAYAPLFDRDTAVPFTRAKTLLFSAVTLWLLARDFRRRTG
ncbi:hypothetical protein [Sagittula sp. SSi028]|uniref:hypothetical protein n=1 Tax=Sagittula sp. SSi028 TaxID=3400636 RepID=UPI003AF7F092